MTRSWPSQPPAHVLPGRLIAGGNSSELVAAGEKTMRLLQDSKEEIDAPHQNRGATPAPSSRVGAHGPEGPSAWAGSNPALCFGRSPALPL